MNEQSQCYQVVDANGSQPNNVIGTYMTRHTSKVDTSPTLLYVGIKIYNHANYGKDGYCRPRKDMKITRVARAKICRYLLL